MTEEPRYTAEEWWYKQEIDRLVASVSHSLTGRRIKDIETLKLVIQEIRLATEPHIKFKVEYDIE